MTKKEIIERGMRLLRRHIQVVNKARINDYWKREDFEDGFEEGLQEYVRDSGFIFKTQTITSTVYNGFYFYLPNDISRDLQIFCNNRLLAIKTPAQVVREYGSGWRAVVGTPIIAVIDYPYENEAMGMTDFYGSNEGNRIPIRLFPRPPTYSEQGHAVISDDERADFITNYLKYELGIIDNGGTYGDPALTFTQIIAALAATPAFFTASNVEIRAEYVPINVVVAEDASPALPEPAHMGIAYYCAYYVAAMSPDEHERALAAEFYSRYKRTLVTYNSDNMLGVKRKIRRNAAFRGV